ncbi:MAG TPA: hypothetical protein VFT45_19845 [Longimicrobium sp.]|nr:hypothetical protein [Longimicrobium sp.]
MPVTSRLTIVPKFVWPVGWLGLLGWRSVLAFTDSPRLRWGPGVDPAWGKAVMAGLFALGVFVAVRVSARLKRVHLVRGGLHVSNYFREIRVPWSDVERVVVHGRFKGRHMPIVEMTLRRRGAFGRHISLLPASPEALARLQADAGADIPWVRR